MPKHYLYYIILIIYFTLPWYIATCTVYTSCAKECPLLCIYSLPAYSAIDCGDPGTPTNGQRSLSKTTPGRAVAYTCDVGYALQGSSSRTCQPNGQWSGSVPQCNGMLVYGLQAKY